MRRAVITGIGVVTPLGVGIEKFWSQVIQNKSGLSYQNDFADFNFSSKSYGILRNFDPAQHDLSACEIRRMDRNAQFGKIAVLEAVHNAGIDMENEIPERIGINIANAVAGTKFMDEEFIVLTDGGKSSVDVEDASPYSYSKSMPNTTTTEAAAATKVMGQAITTATGCTAGIDSVGYAYDSIRFDDADVVIAGAAEAPITPVTIAAFEAICTLSGNNEPPEKASRPFCKTRNGFVLGEGAGVLIVEEYEHARKRGANI
ncbi:MAG: beta-ketoacyl-[acyl-carrier-protein] synthase family protein, partial [Chitinivibrionales bacterium]|nr:beta-ketoacyl-[acyl-carrier-protein] synthase family protein [Chitinivibrionales bacterium]